MRSLILLALVGIAILPICLAAENCGEGTPCPNGCCPYEKGVCCGNYCCSTGAHCTRSGCGSGNFLNLPQKFDFESNVVSEDVSEIADIVEGVLSGLGTGAGATSVTECITNASDVITGIESAISDFKGKNYADFVGALASAIEEFPTAITNCGGAVQQAEEVAKGIDIFKNPASFVAHVGKDLIINGINIYKEISQAISDYDAANYEQFGYNIGLSIEQLVVGKNSTDMYSVSPALTEGLQIVEGVLEGALEGVHLSDVVDCFDDAENVVEQCASAVELFSKGGVNNIKTGLTNLANGLGQLPTAISTCTSAVKEAESLASSIKGFSSPWSFAYKVGKSLIVNGKEIWDDIEDAIASYKAQNYEQFGFSIGQALAALVDLPEEVMDGSVSPAVQEGLQIVEGLLEGALEGVHLTDVVDCFDDAESVVEQCAGAVKLFSAGGATNIKNALSELATAFGQLPTSISTCTSAVQEAEQLASEIKGFASPWSFAYEVGKSLILNGREIYGDITTAITAYKNKDYVQFGYNIGLALDTLLGAQVQSGITLNPAEEEGLQIVEGVLEGALEGVHLTDVIDCFDDAENVVEQCASAVKLFSQGGVKNVKNALSDLASGLGQIPTAISTCTSAAKEAEALASSIKSFASPWSFAYKVGKSLIVNGREIWDDIEDAISSYKAKNYEQFGFSIGQALATLLDLPQDQMDLETSPAVQEGLQIVEGVLEGALEGVHLEDVIDCFDDAKTVIEQSTTAVELFSKGSTSDVSRALVELAQALGQLPSAVSTCTEAVEDAKNLASAIEAFSSPWDFAYHVGKSLIVNGHEIYDEIDTAVTDFKTQDYEQFGYNIGLAIGQVLDA